MIEWKLVIQVKRRQGMTAANGFRSSEIRVIASEDIFRWRLAVME